MTSQVFEFLDKYSIASPNEDDRPIDRVIRDGRSQARNTGSLHLNVDLVANRHLMTFVHMSFQTF